MKVFSSSYTLDYDWDEVSTGNWRKYCPWNDKSTHVVGVDVLSRSIDPATGILRTERLITCNQSAPAWVLKLFGGSSTSLVHETSYVDPSSRTVTMVSANMTWSNLLSVRETVKYTPAPDARESKTLFSQTAQITALCGGWQKIRNKVEEASVERFGENAKKGREGFENVLEMSRRVFAEERKREESVGKMRL